MEGCARLTLVTEYKGYTQAADAALTIRAFLEKILGEEYNKDEYVILVDVRKVD